MAARRLALAAIVAWALLLPAGAGAATIVPNVTGDAPNGSLDDVGCTLRDAVQSANLNQTIPNGCNGDNAGADVIVLQSGKTYVLSTHGIDDANAVGDLDISGPLTIRSSGPGLARIDAVSNTSPGPPVGADRAIHVLASAGAVTLEGVRVEGGFVGNSTSGYAGGGGILTESLLTLRNSEVVGNRVQGSGYLFGGGVWAQGPTARLRILASTIADNVIVRQDITPAAGGGVATYPNVTELTIENSTVTANRVEAGFNAQAGGIFGGDYLNGPAATLTNVTVTANSAGTKGGIWLRGSISGSLIAGNTVAEGDAHDCYSSGSIVSGGGNILGNGGEGGFNCGFTAATDLVGSSAAPVLPNLGTLVDNGGPTRTRVPNPGSPAIDRGGPCPATDQRGLFRFAAAPCDSGAVEVGASSTPPPPPAALPPPAPAGPAVVSPTGRRARALARCGKLKKATKKKTRKARQRCRANARKVPV